MSDVLVADDDGLVRCPWTSIPPENRRYHDDESGLPAGNERRIYEKMCLEGFQSGLSWENPRSWGKHRLASGRA
jgi:DNA-3-methyladenine glycosylase I